MSKESARHWICWQLMHRRRLLVEQATRTNGTAIVKVALANASVRIRRNGGIALLQVNNGTGLLILTPAGIAGTFSGSVALNVPGISLSGTLRVSVNTNSAPVNETFMVWSPDADLEPRRAGTSIRVEGPALRCTFWDNRFAGNFALEQMTLARERRLRKVVRIAATNLSVDLGDGVNPLVHVSNGQGFMLLRADGLAGTFTADVSLNVPGVTLTGTLGVKINTTSTEVHEGFLVGDVTVALDLPTGPYLKVEGTTLQLSMLGQTLAGNFAFEESTTAGGAHVVRVAASNLELELGDGSRSLVRLTNGTGYLLHADRGHRGSAFRECHCRCSERDSDGIVRAEDQHDHGGDFRFVHSEWANGQSGFPGRAICPPERHGNPSGADGIGFERQLG